MSFSTQSWYSVSIANTDGQHRHMPWFPVIRLSARALAQLCSQMHFSLHVGCSQLLPVVSYLGHLLAQIACAKQHSSLLSTSNDLSFPASYSDICPFSYHSCCSFIMTALKQPTVIMVSKMLVPIFFAPITIPHSNSSKSFCFPMHWLCGDELITIHIYTYTKGPKYCNHPCFIQVKSNCG